VVRSDSTAALFSVENQKSKDARTNAVVREIALDLAMGACRIDVSEHLASTMNTSADALSRLAQPTAGALLKTPDHNEKTPIKELSRAVWH